MWQVSSNYRKAAVACPAISQQLGASDEVSGDVDELSAANNALEWACDIDLISMTKIMQQTRSCRQNTRGRRVSRKQCMAQPHSKVFALACCALRSEYE